MNLKRTGMKKSLEEQQLAEIKEKDPFFVLKYVGYFTAGLDQHRDDIDYQDFVKMCKFYLCDKRGVLLKDPIWDKYDDEEIITEYYAILFKENQEVRKEFEANLSGYDLDDLEWMDEEIAKNRQKLEKQNKELEEELNFDPSEEDEDGKESD